MTQSLAQIRSSTTSGGNIFKIFFKTRPAIRLKIFRSFFWVQKKGGSEICLNENFFFHLKDLPCRICFQQEVCSQIQKRIGRFLEAIVLRY